jgi:hypothetical protein
MSLFMQCNRVSIEVTPSSALIFYHVDLAILSLLLSM